MSIKRAFVYVADKTGLVKFTNELVAQDIELYTFGSTQLYLKNHHIPHKPIKEILVEAEYDHLVQMDRYPDLTELITNIESPYHLDLIVANFASMETLINNVRCQLWDVQFSIDTEISYLLRTAAKNYDRVIPIVLPSDYVDFMKVLINDKITDVCRIKYAQKVFAHTSKYDSIVSQYMFPHTI